MIIKKPSFLAQRIIGGVILALWALTTSNYYFFKLIGGRYDKDVMVISFVIGGLYMVLLGPTVEEIKEYRDSKR